MLRLIPCRGRRLQFGGKACPRGLIYLAVMCTCAVWQIGSVLYPLLLTLLHCRLLLIQKVRPKRRYYGYITVTIEQWTVGWLWAMDCSVCTDGVCKKAHVAARSVTNCRTGRTLARTTHCWRTSAWYMLQHVRACQGWRWINVEVRVRIDRPTQTYGTCVGFAQIQWVLGRPSCEACKFSLVQPMHEWNYSPCQYAWICGPSSIL